MWSIMARFTHFLLFFTLFVPSLARTIGGRPERWIQPYKRAPLQNIVTWDNSSLLVNEKRIMFYSGEFHPFRLPVPGLWLDVFQKIRSMGYTGVSFYTDWALLEGKPGEFSAKGVFALEPFFDAAKQAGIYLLARPGPYINAEVSGGGFPGWLQRIKGHPRTADSSYLTSTELYVKSIGAIIAKAQITNGGPVILFQPENEYTGAAPGFKFPDAKYFQFVQDQFRAAGIVVPFISNDASASGHNAPGQPAAVDIYGHDGYPLGFDCANPSVWPAGKLPTNWRDVHLKQSPSTPYSIPEFQAGSFDPWGGPGFEQCTALLNQEFQRVFNKNNYGFGVSIFNLYMTYGGTNWGNLGHPGGYTSYDYGAVIAEDRSVHREKYSEAKLEANFLVASLSYLTAVPGPARSDAYYTNSRDIMVTPLQNGATKYLIVRHTDYASTASTPYRLILNNTSAGDLAIPLAGGVLALHGRDSKIHVVDYMVGDINLLYSTAEILTWKRYKGRTVLIVYTGPDEQHEMGVSLSSGKTLPTTLLGNGVNAAVYNGITILSWRTTAADRAIRLGPLDIYFIDRNSAYQHWVLDVPQNTTNDTPYIYTGSSHVILKGGYLMRTARVSGTTLALTGDLAPTEQLSQPLRIIFGAPPKMTRLTFNGQDLGFRQDANGIVTAAITYNEPGFSLPTLADLTWNYADSLPEIQPVYSDATWPIADYPQTDNTLRNLTTPTSLYGSDYGYHTGALVYRGRFKANGDESTLFLTTQGGSAFGMSAWLDSNFLGSFVGFDAASSSNKTFKIPRLTRGRDSVLTVVVDNMGLDENWIVGSDEMKRPRGILDFRLSGHAKQDVTWKLTGNFGGENYPDKARGPLNEGGLWAERQGYHLPAPPVDGWTKVKGGPMQGIGRAGIAFFTTSFELNMPRGYDIPLSVVFSNVTTSPPEPGTLITPSSPPPSVPNPPVIVPPPIPAPQIPKPVTPVPTTTTPPSRPPPPEKPPPEQPPPVKPPPVSTPPNSTTTAIPTTPIVTTPPTTSVPQTSNGTVPWNSPVSTQFGNPPPPQPKSSSTPLKTPPPTTWDSPLSTQFGDRPPKPPPGSQPLPSSSASIPPTTLNSTTPGPPPPEGTWPSITRSDQHTGKTTTPLLTTNSTSNPTLPSTTTILDWTVTWTSTSSLPPAQNPPTPTWASSNSTSTSTPIAPPGPPAQTPTWTSSTSTPAPILPEPTWAPVVPPLQTTPPLAPTWPDVPPSPAPTKPNQAPPQNQLPPKAVNPDQVAPKPANPNQLPPKAVNPDQVAPKPVNPNQVPPKAVNPDQVAPNLGNSNRVPPKAVNPNQVAPKPANPNQLPPKAVNPNQFPPTAVNPNQVPPKAVNPNQVPPKAVNPNQVPPGPTYPDQGLLPGASTPDRLPPSNPRPKDPSQTAPKPFNPYYAGSWGQPRPNPPTLPNQNNPSPDQPFLDPKWPNTQYPAGPPGQQYPNQPYPGQPFPNQPRPTQPAFPFNGASYPRLGMQPPDSPVSHYADPSREPGDQDFPGWDARRIESGEQEQPAPPLQELPPSPLVSLSYLGEENSNPRHIRTSLSPTNSSTSSTTTGTSQIDTAESEMPPDDSPNISSYRIQIFVNGWQFGKYVSNIGPQTRFPVPEGIWNYNGVNTLSMTFWALDKQGAKVEDMRLVAGPAILTGYRQVEVVESPRWVQRKGAY